MLNKSTCDTYLPLWQADAEGTSVASAVPTREEINPQYQWRLEDIYENHDVWNEDMKKVQELVQELKQLQGHLGDSAETLLRGFRLQDNISHIMGRLFQYAKMRRDEDNANPTYQAMTDQAMSLWIRLDSEKAFFVPEFLSLPEETVRNYVSQDETGFHDFKFGIENLLRQKPHVLSAEQEALLAAAGEMAHAPDQIFSMFNDADIRFPTVKDDEGRMVELTHGRYGQLMESNKRDVRKDAFEGMLQTYAKFKNTLAAVYAANVKKDVFYANVRNYPSALEASLDDDNVPVSVYDNLIAAVHESLPAMTKYMELRKKVLGLDELHLYDMYPPMVQDVDFKMGYEEAVKTVHAAVAPLGAEYQKVALEGMQKDWVDVYETRGKTSGAYSWSTYGVHPYILLNYQDRLNDVYTLAHELGHAMHSWYSFREQPHVTSHYTIFVAEVASTCNEALLTHYLLQNTNDKKFQAYLINHELSGIRATLFRQTMFAEFEKLAHGYAEQGGSLTPEWLCDTYYKLNQTYFGSVAVVDKDIEMEWARIPHFYNAFYVYKYATGISAATALSQKIINEGAPAVERYLKFLGSGGSNYPIELLKAAGVDMTSPEPVKATLAHFSRRVDQLAELLK